MKTLICAFLAMVAYQLWVKRQEQHEFERVMSWRNRCSGGFGA
jgi:hypothetical protein